MPAGWNTPDSVDGKKRKKGARAAPRQGILDTADR
jgi:hypothetical protein